MKESINIRRSLCVTAVAILCCTQVISAQVNSSMEGAGTSAGTPSSGHADRVFSASLTTIEHEHLKFKIRVTNPARSKVVVRIQNDAGLEFVDSAFDVELFEQVFNLRDVEDGRYTIKIVKGKERIVKHFEFKTQTQSTRKVQEL